MSKWLTTICLILGSLLPIAVDTGNTHLFNPDWDEHSRVHEVWRLTTNLFIAIIGLYILWKKDNILLPAILSSCIILGFHISVLTMPLYAGLSLALACDMRVMASNAIMTTAFARVGFSGDYGGTFFMSQLIGTAKARQLYFMSERVSAQEALSLGLTNWVCESDELATKTQEIAAQLAVGPAVAYRYMKENFARAMSSGDVHISTCSLVLASIISMTTGLTPATPGVTLEAKKFGLKAGGACDLSTGWDFR